jgi:hypothetical protein
VQWTEWDTRIEAPSSMTLRQLVEWLKQTHHLPVLALQYEGYSSPPLYNEVEALNEDKMSMVRAAVFSLRRCNLPPLKLLLQKLVDVVTYKTEQSVQSILKDNYFIDVSILLHVEPKQALPCLRIVLDET